MTQEQLTFSTDPNVRYECYSRHEVTAKRSGKVRKKWYFLGWYPISEDLSKLPHKIKGDFLIIGHEDGDMTRYRITTPVSN